MSEVAPIGSGLAGDALKGLEYVIVDVETTGGSAAGGHRITEIAALLVGTDGVVLDEWTTLVNPERPIPAFITRLTNISWEMVKDAPRFAEVADDLARFLDGRVFVAHNASFDWQVISHELTRARGTAPSGRVLCTMRLARKVVPEVPSRSLDALAYYFGIDNEARHRAYGDARVTARLFGRLMERVAEREIESWVALEELLGQRKPRRRRRGPATPSSMDVGDVPWT